MCGQNGVAGVVSVPAEVAFKKGLVYNSIRGTDSTGVASIKTWINKETEKPEVVIAKELGNVYNLFDVHRWMQSDFTSVMSGNHRALLGHCRSSTRGASSRNNAHPFFHGDIIGTHNGTLDNTSHNKLIGRQKFGTDSEAFFHEVSVNGIEETMKKLNHKDDAYAFVWFDLGKDTINFLRNDKRPLFYAFNKNQDMIFWSSEFYHLASLMSDIDHEDKFIYELPVDHHYSWEVPSSGQKFNKAHVVKREPVKNPLVVGNTRTQNGGSTSNYKDDGWFDPRTGFFKKWNRETFQHEYAVHQYGTYYPTIELCWDNMTPFQKESREKQGKVPYEVQYRSKIPQQQTLNLNGKNGQINCSTIEDAKASIKRKKLEEALNGEELPLIWGDDGRKVFWDPKESLYKVFQFSNFREGWTKEETKKCPEYVPFTLLDIQSRHQFKHSGKKKRKVISFRGFNGCLLVKESFEKLMTNGCVSCSRVPQWGNDVAFVTPQDFLCEHCSRDTSNIVMLKQLSSK